MAVYYKFKSAKDYDSVAIGHFISVGHLKEKIFELKHLGRGTDFDLVVTNAQTNEEYLDEEMLIPKNTSVLICRIPGRPRKPIVTAPVTEREEKNVGTDYDGDQAVKDSFAGDLSAMKYAEEFEWDEFGDDLYSIPETVPVRSSIPVQDALPVSKEDEESKIKALIDTPSLDWQCQPSDGFGPGRVFGRGIGGRFGRGGFEKKTPPQGYVCHRCKVPGHFIQHCQTNGDPNFDIRRVKPPTGIPKSMLMANPDGSYALPSGVAAVLKPNEAAFEKEIEGMPSTRSVGDLPPELHCPLCKQVMKDAVLTSKCCYTSFCDKCIRDHIISKSTCICGATNILADDLLPNKTLRDTINRILESNNNSAENGETSFQAPDMDSRNPQVMVPSPTHSAASKAHPEPGPPTQRDESSKIADTAGEYKSSNFPLIQEKGRTVEVPDVSEATHDSRAVKDAASQGSAPLADEELQHKPISGEAGKKKKKKKTCAPPGAVAEMPWRNSQDIAPENYMMPLGPAAFNPYWNGMQPGFDGFMPPYGGPMPYMGYGYNPMEFPFGGGLPHDPFGGHGFVMPYGPPQPQRDLAGPPLLSRAEFEAHKADLKRKREMERRDERQSSKDGEYGREGSSTGYVSSKSKFKLTPPLSDHHLTYPNRSGRHSPDRCPRDVERVPRPSSKKSSDQEQLDQHRETHKHRDQHHHRSSHKRHSLTPSESQPVSSTADKKSKSRISSRISYPGSDSSPPKKRKLSTEVPAAAGGLSLSHRGGPALSNGGHHEEHNKVTRKSEAYISVDHNDSSDDERHFKRRPSRYNSSPPPAAAAAEEEHRHSRGREREHYSSSKHR